MLARCSKCGKPVFFQNGRKESECGYCYARLRFSDLEILKPETLDWKKPLYDEAAAAKEPGQAVRWLILLGDYADAPQRLERIRSEERERRKVFENEIDAATEIGRIDQIIRNVKETKWNLYSAEDVERVLDEAREKKTLLRQKEDRKRLEELRKQVETAAWREGIGDSTLRDIKSLLHLQGAAELLEKAKAKREALQREKDLTELEELLKSIQSAPSVWLVDRLIGRIQSVNPCPEKEIALTSAYEKRARLLQAEAEEQEKKKRKNETECSGSS